MAPGKARCDSVCDPRILRTEMGSGRSGLGLVAMAPTSEICKKALHPVSERTPFRKGSSW